MVAISTNTFPTLEQLTYGIEVDFSELKKALAAVTEDLDHSMILRVDDPAVAAVRVDGGRFVLLDVNPTAENLARLIFRRLSKRFTVSRVDVWETSKYKVSAILVNQPYVSVVDAGGPR